ncbi:MAG TPA: hypothetical protein VEQ41_01580 [Solirubrobacterales bacterium]|nr:hypothetical protein [Solirubrobacterales bacterium]
MSPGEEQEQTSLIAFDAPAAAVQAALEGLSNIDAGDVAVTELSSADPDVHEYAVEFTGRYAATDVRELSGSSSPPGGGLTGSESVVRVKPALPIPAFETCTVASECRPGAPGAAGGGMSAPWQLAYDQAADVLYVASVGRITAFDQDGTFLRLWGAGVVAPGGAGDQPTNETQRVMKSPHPLLAPDGGTFALKFAPSVDGPREQTAEIPLGASAAQIQSALEALASIGPGDVSVGGPSGGPWTVEFTGAYADVALPLMETDNSNLTRGGLGGNSRIGMYVERKRAAGGHEICVQSAQCRVGNLGGDAAGQINGHVSTGSPPVPSLAVGPNGHVFAGDLRNARINEYEADGDFVRSWGWGVDTEASQFQICTAISGCDRAVPNYEAVTVPGQFATEYSTTGGEMPTELAVDAAGIVYAVNADWRSGEPRGVRIERFDSAATTPGALLLGPIRSQNPVSPAPAGPLPLPQINAFPTDLEIDPGNGNLYYQRPSGEVLEIDVGDPVGVVDTHFVGFGSRVSGLGYADAGDRLFASEPEGSRVVVAGATGTAPPAATLHDPEVTSTSTAVFRGEVTPGGPPGLVTSYRFEYRKSGDPTWTRLPSSDLPIGDGSEPVAVEQVASGLDVAVDYEVRLVATKEFGAGQATTPSKVFFLGTLPPTIATAYPVARTDTEASLTGLINPRNRATTYYFEWGTDASYGNRVPVPGASLPAVSGTREVIVRIGGLSPETTYHYRLLADNGVEEAPGDTLIEGEDVAFTTRAVSPRRPDRAYEMVTPPFKVVRAATAFADAVGNNPNPGVPSPSGDTVLWQVPFFPLSEEVEWPAGTDRRIIRRTPQGWVHETQNTLPIIGLPNFVQHSVLATSGNGETLALRSFSGVTAGQPEAGGVLPSEGAYANRLYTFRKGTGVKGYNPWLTNAERQVIDLEPSPRLPGGGYHLSTFDDHALIDDDGTAMARWGLYGGLAEDPATPEDDDPSDDQALGGDTIYLQRASDPLAMPTAPKDLVNECTGTGGGATRIPARTSTGRISTAVCGEGQLTHRRGAVVGGGGQAQQVKLGQGPATTALSEDGHRVFFESPDPHTARYACGPETGIETDCPPQLFVRQYGSGGEPVVRWISQSRSVSGAGGFTGAQIANQSVAQMGAGVLFQGSARDGRYVYFQTNAPLVPTDPNGGNSITSGSASGASWDLYRYELPESLDENPGAGTLLRISGGPAGDADPNTNPHTAHNVDDNGTSLRYLSDDGQRAYFVTGSPIAGADETPPQGVATTPGAASGAASGTGRNLYLFDATKSGAERYRFIARLPFSTDGMSACASWGKLRDFGTDDVSGRGLAPKPGNCFRGTPDGEQVIFFTDGQLSTEDADLHGDVYLYDAEADELVRVSAPPPGAEPYVCNGPDVTLAPGPGEGCNADLGRGPSGGLGGSASGDPDALRGFSGLRHYNISENPDGTTSVYFESRSELVPEDTNGSHFDTYEWREGRLHLISPGDSADHSWYSGNSLDGRDVFIWTSARIDPREIDPADFDVYDARIGGGFPYTAPPEPCDVLAFECEGQATPPPTVPAPASNGFNGAGNVPTKPKRPRCRNGKVRRRGRCVVKAKKRAAKKRRAAAKRKGGAR